jgi:hypothetical protein
MILSQSKGEDFCFKGNPGKGIFGGYKIFLKEDNSRVNTA